MRIVRLAIATSDDGTKCVQECPQTRLEEGWICTAFHDYLRHDRARLPACVAAEDAANGYESLTHDVRLTPATPTTAIGRRAVFDWWSLRRDEAALRGQVAVPRGVWSGG